MEKGEVIQKLIFFTSEITLYIYILNAFTENPYSKLMRRNVVYNPITTSSHATSHDR